MSKIESFYNPTTRCLVARMTHVEELQKELAAERARNAELVKGIKSILPKPPYHPTLEPEWVYLSGLIESKQNTP